MGLIQFPPNPSPGDQYIVPGGPKYEWDGSKWVCIGGSGGGGGGGGGLSPIPNDTVLGNVSGAEQIPTALTGAQVTALLTPFDATDQGVVPAPGAADPGTNVLLSSGAWGDATSVVGIYPTAQPGLVPAAGTAPINAALQADGTWRVPGTRWVNITDTDYTATPNDEVINYQVLTGSRTFTLPTYATTAVGTKFTIRLRLTAGTSFWIAAAPGDPLVLLTFTNTDTGTISCGYGSVAPSFRIRSPSFSTSGIIEILRGTNSWNVTNLGVPLNGDYWTLPGLVPGPVINTPIDTFLRSDMTWMVPGTNSILLAAGSNYNIQRSDDYLHFGSYTATTSLNLPSFATVPMGKVIRISVWQPAAGTQLILGSGTGTFLIVWQAEWQVGNVYTIDFPVYNQGAIITIIRSNANWILYNEGRPLLGNLDGLPVNLPGLMPSPPAGTPAAAVLHADGTWY